MLAALLFAIAARKNHVHKPQQSWDGVWKTPAVPPQRLLVAYAGSTADPRTLARQHRHVRASWAMMQVEYPRWSLRCLLATPDPSPTAVEYSHSDHGTERCAELTVRVPSDQQELRRGYLVLRLLNWLGGGAHEMPVGSSFAWAKDEGPHAFDYLLKPRCSRAPTFDTFTWRRRQQR